MLNAGTAIGILFAVLALNNQFRDLGAEVKTNTVNLGKLAISVDDMRNDIRVIREIQQLDTYRYISREQFDAWLDALEKTMPEIRWPHMKR